MATNNTGAENFTCRMKTTKWGWDGIVAKAIQEKGK